MKHCVLILITCAVIYTSVLGAEGQTHQQYLQEYSLCTGSDPEFVVDEILNHYIRARQWLDEGNDPPIVGVLALTGKPIYHGWSDQLYEAAVGVQKCFGAAWIINDTVPVEAASQVIDDMVATGAKVIFAGALEYVPEIIPLASEKYPNIGFVTPFFDPVLADVPGARAVNARYTDATYLLGYISQLMSKNDHVIYIPAVQFSVEYQVVNTFYYGMQDAAAEFDQSLKSLTIKWAPNYVDEDLNMGAIESVLKEYPQGVNSVIGLSSAIYNIHRNLQDQGIISTTGSSNLPPYVGNLLLGGSVSKWEVSLVTAYSYYLFSGNGNGWGSETPFMLDSSIYSGGITLGTLSPIIPQHVTDGVNRIRARMQSSFQASNDIWCGPRVQYILPPGETVDNVTGCLTSAQQFAMNRVDPNITDLGVYVIPITEITQSVGSRIGMSIIISISVILTLISVMIILMYRDHAIIKFHSPNLSLVLLFFLLLAEVGLVLTIPDKNAALCYVAYALYGFGMFGAISMLVCKTYAVARIDKNSRDMRANPIRLIDVLPVFFILYIVAGGLIIAYLAVTPGSKTLTNVDSLELNKYEIMEVCDFNTASEVITWLLVGYELILFGPVLFAISFYLSQSRIGTWRQILRSAFLGSSFAIGITIAGIACVLAIEDNQIGLQWILFIFAVLILMLGIWGPFFVPQVWTMIFNRGSSLAGSANNYGRTKGRSATSGMDSDTPRSFDTGGNASNCDTNPNN